MERALPQTQPWPVPLRSRLHGIRAGLDDDQRGLAARYLPMAESLADGYKSRHRIEREELRSAAYLALVEAARTFDPRRRVNFATYARHRIRGALRDCVRFLLSDSWRGGRTRRPFFRSLEDESKLHGRVVGMAEPRAIGTEIESLESVESWLRRLPRNHALICRLLYIGGKGQDEVARILGYSRTYLSRMHAEALGWLLDEVEGDRAREQDLEAKKSE
jgi:RNA polymerase sigma factor (sigma-70 family)